MNNLFDYRDYRDFLKDRIAELKKARVKVSCRAIAAELGISSAGHVSQMINGTAVITETQLPKLMELFQITKKSEQEYFSLLVRYHQTGPMNEKRELLREIAGKSGKRGVKVSRDQYEFYQKWYYAAIRDILDIAPFSGDFKSLAQMVEPAISVQEARSAISILERLGMIIRNEKGVYQAASKILEADFAEDSRVVLSGYAEAMINQAKHALNRMDPSERSISWTGFSASEAGFDLIRDEIRLFRERIMEIVEKDTAASRVYHMNIHCFPLSKDLGEASHE